MVKEYCSLADQELYYTLPFKMIDYTQINSTLRMHLCESGKIDGLRTLLQANGDESFDSNDINMISNYIEMIRGEGVCFLLDGYDEYVKLPDGYDYVTSLIKCKTLHNTSKL